MKNKNNFNNLFDSILLTLMTLSYISFYFVSMYYGVLHPREGTNPIAALVGLTITFGGGSIVCITMLIIGCYEYWYLDDVSITSKKIFRKKKVILLNQIEKVEKKTVNAIIFCNYSCEAYIIYSGKTKIIIYINNKKKIQDLENELKKYIDN